MYSRADHSRHRKCLLRHDLIECGLPTEATQGKPADRLAIHQYRDQRHLPAGQKQSSPTGPHTLLIHLVYLRCTTTSKYSQVAYRDGFGSRPIERSRFPPRAQLSSPKLKLISWLSLCMNETKPWTFPHWTLAFSSSAKYQDPKYHRLDEEVGRSCTYY